MVGALSDLYQRAYDAAMGLPHQATPASSGDEQQGAGGEPAAAADAAAAAVGGSEELMGARRKAAQDMLESGLSGLGLNVQVRTQSGRV